MPLYEAPEITLLLTVSSLLYFMNAAEAIFTHVLEAGLIGSLAVGIVYGPDAGNMIPEFISETLLVIGYIGLLLLVFEAGMSTNLSLLFRNVTLSLVTGSIGILVPIALSIILFHFGFGYTVLQGFGAGAALSSTSLGTTLALLKPELRQTKMGVVLLSAALFDDVVGLVIAAVIADLSAASGRITWQAIIRPIFVSIAFAAVTGGLILALRSVTAKFSLEIKRFVYQGKTQVFLMVSLLSGVVAAAKYAGTSELFGAYLCGVFIAQTFYAIPGTSDEAAADIDVHNDVSLTLNTSGIYSPHPAFTVFIQPLLQYFLSPIFFVSIGLSLPIRSLGSVNGSSRVIWRGWVYSLLMMVAKMLTGIPFIAWSDKDTGKRWFRLGGRKQSGGGSISSAPTTLTLTDLQSAVLVGIAMVARGEIALIVAQLARPLLNGDEGNEEGTSEAFAVVIWAILVNTVAAAAGVGLMLRRMNSKLGLSAGSKE
ncbi:sodium-hydrogen antiporter [Moniliophthora roreri MCA 2997]|uniref:Sodium-hydrogen antiporter n=2 Tax=Moniliophthora roreri TaxID=221103 RepID=V2XC00_MONRO|nr:sodium-hydrogen antiporter [Moniliophthora roreri MCA 2997]KAI3611089.1 sodium-hydrogen antiporter [Moniliophthora roreri]